MVITATRLPLPVPVSCADFAGTSTVVFNGASALSAAAILNLTATQLRVIVPEDAQTGPIGINLKNGTVLETAVFTLTPPLPTISSFKPTSYAFRRHPPTITDDSGVNANALADLAAATSGHYRPQ